MRPAGIYIQISAFPLLEMLYCLLCLMVIVFTFIVFFSIYKRKLAKKEKKWLALISTIISEIIFFEEEEGKHIEVKVEAKLLQNPRFRQCFLNEILHVKKNLFGAPVTNLKKLFELLEFDKDSSLKIQSNKWHVKAKGIQELSVMEQSQYVKQIFRLTNDPHELVRNEAQCALVNFYGFNGFRFLNILIYPISQWQQMQLLNYLHDAKTTDTQQLKKWLVSRNNSVVTLGLRLAAFYNAYDVYNNVIRCMQNPDQNIRLCALRYLTRVSEEGTADEIIKGYSSSDKNVRLRILATLQKVGDEKQIPFLLKQLQDTDDAIKVAAAKTLSVLHPLGTVFFQTHLFADEDPWRTIFSQIKNERAA